MHLVVLLYMQIVTMSIKTFFFKLLFQIILFLSSGPISLKGVD